MRDKKYELIAAGIEGATLAEQAASLGGEVAGFDNVTANSFYVDGIGLEPRLIGAIGAATETGKVSAPVKGFNGLYVFQVDDIRRGDAQTAEASRCALRRCSKVAFRSWCSRPSRSWPRSKTCAASISDNGRIGGAFSA